MTQAPSEPSGRGPGFWAWVLGNATSVGACRFSLFLLRLMVGAIFIAHGGQKAFGWLGGKGFEATKQMVASLQLLGDASLKLPYPEVFAVLLIVGELGGGAGLVLGLATRICALMTAVVMGVALTTVHYGQGFLDTHLQQMLLVASLALLISGGGWLTVWPGRKREL